MKIAFDTNLVVRMIVLDDEPKLRKITGVLAKHGAKDIFVSGVVLMETYFVATKLYKIPKNKTLDAFEDLMKIEQFSFESEAAVRQALVKSKKGFEFNDSLIGEIAAAKNLKTLTFDKGLKGNNNFEVI